MKLTVMKKARTGKLENAVEWEIIIIDVTMEDWKAIGKKRSKN
jgi:hypothetical protein